MFSALKSDIIIPESEYTITATRASGPGGQHVNKVATAIVLRFDINASSIPEKIKQRLLESGSRRVTHEGILVIKSGALKSQLGNKKAAIRRLHEIVNSVAQEKKKRKKTRPSATSVEKRLQEKAQRSDIKEQRKKPKL